MKQGKEIFHDMNYFCLRLLLCVHVSVQQDTLPCALALALASAERPLPLLVAKYTVAASHNTGIPTSAWPH